MRHSHAPQPEPADADGCLWICINPDCPELCAGELETEDLVEGGVPQELAARLMRLIDFYEDTIEELRAQGAGHGEQGADAAGGGVAGVVNFSAIETPSGGQL